LQPTLREFLGQVLDVLEAVVGDRFPGLRKLLGREPEKSKTETQKQQIDTLLSEATVLGDEREGYEVTLKLMKDVFANPESNQSQVRELYAHLAGNSSVKTLI